MVVQLHKGFMKVYRNQTTMLEGSTDLMEYKVEGATGWFVGEVNITLHFIKQKLSHPLDPSQRNWFRISC
jgi:hypothetical protein